MLIKNIRLMDPASKRDEIVDILIEDEKIKSIGKNINIEDKDIIDGKNLIISPGFIDVHVHFRDPGQEYKEDLTTGSQAAAAGGYTSVICMANTKPVMDNENLIKDFVKRAKEQIINVYTISSLTKEMKGQELVDMEKVLEAGALAFSDDGIPNTRNDIVLEAMEKVKELDSLISFHEEDPSLNKENGINHGKVAEEMGLYGAPAISEEIMVARDCYFAYKTGAKVNIQHISAAGSLDIIREYKKLGAKVYCEVTPHHFSSTEDLIREKASLAKMNPPLRTEEDRQAIIKALKDGTIDFIATDHAPHSSKEKNQEFTKAPSGIIGLETALGLGITNLVRENKLSLMELLEKLTINPAKLYKLERGRIKKACQQTL
ncbi:dihydroorotase [Peptoniphilus obesi]|uniref:dihydroorotase n=1 Tax=Peptoniphilus obesi TaxID=1472765 RepID=UPI0004AE42D2|nr:dihydroorotase [Peptoniphilus obesi]